MPAHHLLTPVSNNGRWGYVDHKANLAIHPSFTFAGPFRNGLARVNVGGQVGRHSSEIVGGKWGYIDPTGAFAIPAQFDDADDFSESLAAVNLGAHVKYAAHDDFYYSTGGKWGFIDTSGAFAIPARYTFLRPFHAGLAAASENGRCGYLQGDGQWAIPPHYEATLSFSEGFAAVRPGKRYGYINREAQLIIEPQFELAYDFHNGLAAAHTPDPYLWIFYDTQGKPRLTAPEGTAHVGHFSENRIMANLCDLRRYSDGKIYPHGLRKSLGYLNEKGEWAIKPQFAWGGDFHDQRAWVRLDEGPYAYIKPDGKLLKTPELTEAGNFDLGLAPVQIKGAFALIDTEGKIFWSET